MSKNFSLPNSEPNVNDLAQAYEKRFTRVERAILKQLAAGPTTLQKVDIERYDAPSESEVVIDWPTGKLCWYHDEEWHCVPNDPVHAIKVFSDKKGTTVENGAFRFNIEKDLGGYEIVAVESFVGTSGSGSTVAQIVNMTKGWSILTTPLTIAGGAFHDNGAAVIDLQRNLCDWKDRIWVNITAAGANSKGFGVYITFAPPRLINPPIIP